MLLFYAVLLALGKKNHSVRRPQTLFDLMALTAIYLALAS